MIARKPRGCGLDFTTDLRGRLCLHTVSPYQITALGDPVKYQYCDFYSAKPNRTLEWLRRLLLWF